MDRKEVLGNLNLKTEGEGRFLNKDLEQKTNAI